MVFYVIDRERALYSTCHRTAQQITKKRDTCFRCFPRYAFPLRGDLFFIRVAFVVNCL